MLALTVCKCYCKTFPWYHAAFRATFPFQTPVQELVIWLINGHLDIIFRLNILGPCIFKQLNNTYKCQLPLSQTLLRLTPPTYPRTSFFPTPMWGQFPYLAVATTCRGLPRCFSLHCLSGCIVSVDLELGRDINQALTLKKNRHRVGWWFSW